MTSLKLRAFRNAFYLTKDEASKILEVSVRQITRIESGEQNASRKVTDKVQELLLRRKNAIKECYNLIENSKSYKVAVIFYPTDDGCASRLERAFENSVAMELALLSNKVRLVNFNAKAYTAWLSVNGKDDSKETRSQWATTQL